MFEPMKLPAGQQRRAIEILVDGRPVPARDGDMLAVVLLQAGVVPFRRTPVSGAARAPLCLMGVCFDCLVNVDGAPNMQSCLVQVRAGMQVTLPVGARSIGDAS